MHACHMRRRIDSKRRRHSRLGMLKEEDACMSYEEEDRLHMEEA